MNIIRYHYFYLFFKLEILLNIKVLTSIHRDVESKRKSRLLRVFAVLNIFFLVLIVLAVAIIIRFMAVIKEGMHQLFTFGGCRWFLFLICMFNVHIVLRKCGRINRTICTYLRRGFGECQLFFIEFLSPRMMKMN